MKNFNFTKVAVFLLLLFLSSNLHASKFILSNDSLIDQRTVGKIHEIGSETFSKLGVNIYVHVKSTLNLNANLSTKDKIKYIKEYEAKIVKNLSKPYVLLTIAVEQTHVNLIVSSSLKDIIDKNEILDTYVVPLLASKDKNSTFAKVSAAILNGYAAIADTLASSKNIELKSSIGSAGKVAGTIWKVLMYSLIVIGLLLYIYAILRRKK